MGAPLAALTAVYTAFLFAQARARDMWQSSLLPPHLLVQAVMAGAGAVYLVGLAVGVAPAALDGSVVLFARASGVHALLILGEMVMSGATAHVQMAEREMVHGRFRSFFWFGLAAAALGLAAPWLGPVAVAVGLIGLLAYEHAFVQAGQSVPLA